MSMRSKILPPVGLACTVLVLAPATAAAAPTGVPAARAAASTPPGYVIKTVSKVSLPANDVVSAEARCPKHTVVLSGGGYIASGSVKTGINLSRPENDRSWDVAATNFGSGATTFNVYAVCAKKPAGYQQILSSLVNNPAGQQTSQTVDCPTGDVVLGGGAYADLNVANEVSLVVTSSYPGTFGSSWTAAVSNFSTVGDQMASEAICAPLSAFHNYAIPSTSASDPAGAQKGIIQACTAPAVALGGGNRSSNTSNLRIAIKASQPFPASGTSWKSGENNDATSGTTLTSYAICAT